MDQIELNYLNINGEGYYKISNIDKMRPFFMSIVSDSNHWMFVASNGGLSAGRKDRDNALFPYYTDDKITESSENTGSKSIIVVENKGQLKVWEPFSDKYTGVFSFTRNLYKNVLGNKLIFEEVNHDLGLTFRYEWNSSNLFGFVKKSTLVNHTEESKKIKVLDGLQNIMPFGVDADLQQRASNLVDAYKKNELEIATGLGMYMLSAIIVDKAEPSEALKANVVWSIGMEKPTVLVSTLQLDAFRIGKNIHPETDVRAERGAYFIVSEIELGAGSEKEWMTIANINQGPSAIVAISEMLRSEKNLAEQVLADIEAGSTNLQALTSAADGKQLTADQQRNTRHYANVLFNIMRGGIFDNDYTIEKSDFVSYLSKANKQVYADNQAVLEKLPTAIRLSELKQLAWQTADKDFGRLCFEYLPLKFSRRHGDPSRPWNKFSINTRSEIDGSKILDYQGNWRDIFQNWEALVQSYPAFIDSMIHKFLNATTFDGYNPYRVTKDGFDWETIEADDPWSYIGYWGDHQIIYLLKFLEFIESHYPGTLKKYVSEEVFVYANVPYKIKDYAALLRNPKDTIDFDHELDAEIRTRRKVQGADGALIQNSKHEIVHVNLIEKLLATLLAKVSNLIPEGGIWMNTQRPEWNDANNALVGNGVSMVTLYYIRRFVLFFKDAVANAEVINVSAELSLFLKSTLKGLEHHSHLLGKTISNQDRKSLMDILGQAGSDYRAAIYAKGFSADKQPLSPEELSAFCTVLLKHLDHSIAVNKRADNLFHAYNLMTVENDREVTISHLTEMLEGQVAVLSSGYLSTAEAIELLDGLKESKLYRADQNSYMLYPNRELSRFMDKNHVPAHAVEGSKLLKELIKNGNTQIVEKDIRGNYHFNGNFNNAGSLAAALAQLDKGKYGKVVEEERSQLLALFETVFKHKEFTGRSGTFYGYEGLGSIYWHMVSKLVLAVQECCFKAVANNEDPKLITQLVDHYHEINEGLGIHKSPESYGAFPTDPYSHTPGGKGAQQPGMTGQVKEDILSRFGELGVTVHQGVLGFNPILLREAEFLKVPQTFEYRDVHSTIQQLQLEEASLAFTYCQVPVIYTISNSEGITVVHKDSPDLSFNSLELDLTISEKIFSRTGEIDHIKVQLLRQRLR